MLGFDLRSLWFEIDVYNNCMFQCRGMINEQCEANACTPSTLPFAIHIRIEECITSIASCLGACVAGDWHAQLWELSGEKQQTVLPQGSCYIGCSGKKIAGGCQWLPVVANGCWLLWIDISDCGCLFVAVCGCWWLIVAVSGVLVLVSGCWWLLVAADGG